MPQTPQLALLEVRETQVPPQSVMPVGHWQTPAWQVCPPAVEQSAPHPPQLALLVCRLTQAPPQTVGAEVLQHVPLLQSLVQVVPLSHMPLFAQLTGVFPSQSTDAGKHSPVHWPPAQTYGQVTFETVRRSGPQVTLVLVPVQYE
jgi:hypothetical protein